MRSVLSGGILLALVSGFGSAARAVPAEARPSDENVREARRAMRGFVLPEGFEAELFAAEPMVANPVAFAFDEQGRLYVCETFRQMKGVEDNRPHAFWLLDDLAAETVEDRLAYYHKWAGRFGGMQHFTRFEDRIRIVEDRDDDGRADHAHVFAGGFNDAVEGTGAGVLIRDGRLWYTNIPNLWLMRDTDGDLVADERRVLSTGYGVRTALRGHDLHGLVWGPDGKLYFSLGDRGYNITTADGRHLAPPIDIGRGAVFRCNPDGSELEVFATGLRNPQELAFDAHGNLFTGDNNSDAGDEARLVYLVEGGDSGWDMAFQTLAGEYSRGPWHAEKLWHPYHEGQAAWIVPPVAWVESGPSGFAYYPGVGLPQRYDGHFFLCDFRGDAATSGVRSFAVEPKGAGFEMVDHHQVLGNILATDVAFGYDGKLYVSDWISGWEGLDKGRIYSFHHTGTIDDPAVAHAERLFAEGFTDRPTGELADLLAHADMRVRLRAQFTLAGRGERAIELLAGVASSSENRLARLHAIWGLGQIGREHDRAALERVAALLDDSDAEVRAQALRVLGDNRYEPTARRYIGLLNDPSSRVRFFAAKALGKTRHRQAIDPILHMLEDNADRDPWLRHAGVMALYWMDDPDALLKRADDDDRSARLATLLALRRHGDPRIARFLRDLDAQIVTEAARATYDLPIEEAMDDLAALIRPLMDRTDDAAPQPLLRRVINANYRLGGPQRAETLARFAADQGQPTAMRREAIAVLSHWADPPPRERVLGLYRPLPQRDPEAAREALRPHLLSIVSGSDGRLRAEAIRLGTRYGLALDTRFLLDSLADAAQPIDTRIESLRSLARREADVAERAIDLALGQADAELRAEARDLLAQVSPDRAVDELREAVRYGRLTDVQRAFATLAEMCREDADAILGDQMRRLLAGRLTLGVQLDLLEAARRRAADSPAIQRKLQAYSGGLDADDPLAAYRPMLAGGDAARGRRVFFSHSAAQCVRCHTVDGTGGNAGPVLDGIGKQRDRPYLLEALIHPSARIAEGYGLTIVTLKNGQTHAGTVHELADGRLTITPPAGDTVTVAPGQVAARISSNASAMPPMAGVLTEREIRDVVEFLARLKADAER